MLERTIGSSYSASCEAIDRFLGLSGSPQHADLTVTADPAALAIAEYALAKVQSLETQMSAPIVARPSTRTGG